MLASEQRDGVQIVRMEHGRVNALDVELLDALADHFTQATDARAIVLTGSGSAFSAGADLKRVLEGDDATRAHGIAALSRAFLGIFTFPKPVVAAVNGHAIAGGAVITCAADRRLMAAGTGRIGLAELAVGVPFPIAAFEISRAAVGDGRIAELVYHGEVYPPDEARAVGLIDEVVEPDRLLDAAVAAAERLAAIPAETFAHTKRQIRRPTLERIASHAATDDAVAAQIWSSDEVRARIKATLDALRPS